MKKTLSDLTTWWKDIIVNKIVDIGTKKQHNKPISFSRILSSANHILIILPQDDEDFHECFVFLNAFDFSLRDVHLLTNDFRISLLPIQLRRRALEHSIQDVNKWNLPSNSLIEKIKEKEINAVLDLNRKESVFYNHIIHLLDVELKVGFVKKDSDKLYNLQIVNHEDDAEGSYQNFLNCIKMF
jgi:hypothetical protein